MPAARRPHWIIGLILASVLVEASQLVLTSEALFNAKLESPSAPTEPGCFVWLPSGCPGVIDLEKEETMWFAASVNTSAWLHDVAAEKIYEPRSGARQARSARKLQRTCEARATSFNTICNVDDVAMLFMEEGTLTKQEQSSSGSADEALDSMSREAGQLAVMGSIQLPNDEAEASQNHDSDMADDTEPAAGAAQPARETTGPASEPALAPALTTGPSGSADQPAAATTGSGSDAGQTAASTARSPAAVAAVAPAEAAPAASAEADQKGSARPRPRPQLIPEPLHPWAAADNADDPHDDDLGVGKKEVDVDASSWPMAPGLGPDSKDQELAPGQKEDDFASSGDLLAPGPVSTTAQPARLSPSTSQVLPGWAPQPPEEHGCYVWTPQGCPRQPNFHGDAWKQDKYGELHNNAASGKTACFKRSSMFNAWCGVTDVVMMLVPPKMPSSPSEAGCFIWYPSGCPNQPTVKSNPKQWKHDSWGESNVNARLDRGSCLKRKTNLGGWCGTKDVEVIFVSEEDAREDALAGEAARAVAEAAALQPLGQVVDPGFATTSMPMLPAATPPDAGDEEKSAPREAPDLPEEAGCYVWTPGGCAGQAGFHAQFHWKRDTHGEEHAEAASGPAACEARKATFDTWCGVQDAVMHLVRQEGRFQPEQPEQPGCYVWQPSGCPSKGVESSNKWKHDRWAEENVGARYDSAACFQRKAKFDDFCGSSDAEMLLVTENGAQGTSMPKTSAAMTRGAKRGGYSKVYGDPDDERRPRSGKVYEKDADLLSFPTHASGGAHHTAPPVDAVETPPTERPTESGCFVWIPGGCHSNEQEPPRFRTWQRDSWGERHKRANFNKTACMARKESFDQWCGKHTPVMAWVAPSRPLEPTGPGCYVWHPSGCPRKQSVKVDTNWAHDIWGENNRDAGSSGQACASRKSQYDSFCGTSDVEMLFVDPSGRAGHHTDHPR